MDSQGDFRAQGEAEQAETRQGVLLTSFRNIQLPHWAKQTLPTGDLA